MIDGVLNLFLVLAIVYVVIWLVILLPARMAGARGRSAVVWIFVSIFFSPILAVFLLLVLGDARGRLP